MRTKPGRTYAEFPILPAKEKTYSELNCRKNGNSDVYAAGLLKRLDSHIRLLAAYHPAYKQRGKAVAFYPPQKQGVFEVKVVTPNPLVSIHLYTHLQYKALSAK